MTPEIYSKIGDMLKPKSGLLWFLAVISLWLVLAFILFSAELDNVVQNQVPIGISMLFLIVTWGLLLAVYWFSSGRGLSPDAYTLQSGYKKYVGLLKSWYASLVLTIWFVSAVTILPWMLWKQYVAI